MKTIIYKTKKFQIYMKRNFKENFNFITNILILLLLIFGAISYADTNGIFIQARDVVPGTFGEDEGSGDFTFPSNLNVLNEINTKILNVSDSLKYGGIELDERYVNTGSNEFDDKYVEESQENSITTEMIIDNTISTNDLSDSLITSDKINDGSIGSIDLASDSITSNKIVDKTVSLSDLADNSVDSSKVVNGTISSSDIKNGEIKLEDVSIDSLDNTFALKTDINNLQNQIDTLKTIIGKISFKEEECTPGKHTKGHQCWIKTRIDGSYKLNCKSGDKGAEDSGTWLLREQIDWQGNGGPQVRFEESTGKWKLRTYGRYKNHKAKYSWTSWCYAGGYNK